jgi:calcium-dependent protein kinase
MGWQVASFMRAVLRTLSQCHAHRILHRDIKPGNFMLLNHSDRAPLKAIGELSLICCFLALCRQALFVPSYGSVNRVQHKHSIYVAVDFGLAVFYEPSSLPRTDLGLEGTPWSVFCFCSLAAFMAT